MTFEMLISANVVNDATQNVREETVSPFTSRCVKSAEQRVFRDRLWIKHMSDALGAISALKSFEQNPPSRSYYSFFFEKTK